MTSVPDPVISVSILTYNQREVVGRAIESVLAQRIDVPYEIIIGDDCSDDGTQDVLRRYRARYPGIIQLILHPRRYQNEILGRTNNITNLSNCRGKYTAMLDGDDYWTDPDKLQRQYDRLEADPELTMCLHNSIVVPEGEHPGEQDYPDTMSRGTIRQTGIYTHRDVATRRLEAQIGSLMFRTRCVEYFPEWFWQIVSADFALYLMVSERGKVFYDAAPASVYTVCPTSFSNTAFRTEQVIRRRLDDIKLMAQLFPALANGGPRSERCYAYLHFRLGKIALRRGDLIRATIHCIGTIRRDPRLIPRAIYNRLTPIFASLSLSFTGQLRQVWQ